MGNDVYKYVLGEKQENTKKKSYLHVYSQLINMGFDEDLSLEAAKIYPNNINQAIAMVSKKSTNKQLQQSQNKANKSISTMMKQIPEFQSLKTAMNQYEANTDNIDTIDTAHILNNFLFLMQNYNDNDQFECINDILGECEIEICQIFKRNYRNRTNENINVSTTHQILDKIHCFYHHSFDTGHRLKLDDEKQLYHSLSSKFLISSHIHSTKFNQLEFKEQKQCDKMYSFGTEFAYSPEIGMHEISPKFSTLKQELMTNNICSLTMAKFVAEYNKAILHWKSDYCKQNYFGVHPYDVKTRPKEDITLDMILSLMVYCNYTELQYHFSKTYREHIEQHNNYYHLGKNIKEAVHRFGTDVYRGINPVTNQYYATNNLSFYHGIGENLLFPQIVGSGEGVQIFSPLSTSTSLAVAFNFTNHNNGLVIEFSGRYIYSSASYLAVSWLSDFANEFEHLFIQNNFRLDIINIIKAETQTEYSSVLFAIKVIDGIIGNKGGNVDATCTYWNRAEKFVNDATRHTIKRIIDNQLAETSVIVDEFEQKLFNIYCQNLNCFQINYQIENYKFLTDLFYDFHNKWIKFNTVKCLFPNVSRWDIHGVQICKFAFDDILAYLHQNQLQNSIQMWIYAHQKQTVLINDDSDSESGFDYETLRTMVDMYNEQFIKEDYIVEIRECVYVESVALHNRRKELNIPSLASIIKIPAYKPPLDVEKNADWIHW